MQPATNAWRLARAGAFRPGVSSGARSELTTSNATQTGPRSHPASRPVTVYGAVEVTTGRRVYELGRRRAAEDPAPITSMLAPEQEQSLDHASDSETLAARVPLPATAAQANVMRLHECELQTGQAKHRARRCLTAVRGRLADDHGRDGRRLPSAGPQDAARLYRLAVEYAPARSVLHGVAETGVSPKAIGVKLDLPVRAVPSEHAEEHFGWLCTLVSTDAPASSTSTSKLPGWQPNHPGLLEDLENGDFFPTNGLKPRPRYRRPARSSRPHGATPARVRDAR